MAYKDIAARNAYQKGWYERNKAKHRSYVARNKVTYKQDVRALLKVFRQDGCLLCPEKEPCCLSAHHLRDKEFTIGHATAAGVSLIRLSAELQKCVCVCENCHRKIHAGLLSVNAGVPVNGQAS